MGNVLALIAVAMVMGGVMLIVSGARQHRAAPLQLRERTGVGRMAIGITMLGMVLVGGVYGVVWVVGEAFGKLASV